MSRVFVLELDNCRHDVADAERYGRLETIFARGERRGGMWSEEFPREVIKRLVELDFKPSSDYIVAAGNTVALHVATCAMVSYYGPFRMLFWSAADRRYVTREVGRTDARESRRAVQAG
jgi:hypothetical protein